MSGQDVSEEYFVERFGDFVRVGYRVEADGGGVVVDVGVFLGVEEELALEVGRMLTPGLPGVVAGVVARGVEGWVFYDIEEARMLVRRRLGGVGQPGRGEVDAAGWMFAGLKLGDCELRLGDMECRLTKFGVDFGIWFARGYIEVVRKDPTRRLRRKPVAKLLVAGAKAPQIVEALKKLLEIEEPE